ncbi:PREDICTED: glypican-6-like [Priapulus caudatus]|uniref:Glypican-6-like n=1 Tax=Priapulus caudatus TaxID=37621 RepID=A0ABM1DPX5_PRICU|nr:PREDICTED: glypican-6-like [Priapulus caudatus]
MAVYKNCFWLCVIVLCTVLAPSWCTTSTAGTCTNVKQLYTDRGFHEMDVPHTEIEGENLRICKTGKTCCTEDMEMKLSRYCTKEFSHLLDGSLQVVRSQFTRQTRRFDEFFRSLLKTSRQHLHDMFLRTYGLFYQEHSDVFRALFDDLDRYYAGDDLSLVEAVDSFFRSLYRRMFMLLNVQFVLDDAYLGCVAQYLDELQPFGDVPQKLSIQVKRSFVAARTFVQALAVGRDVITAVSEIEPTQQCQQALMRMSYCPSCSGITTVKACNNYCLNIMKGCLAYHAELNTEWNKYIGELQKLGLRLKGPFNIESVVEPINVKISDAIMNFQETGMQVSHKVFSGCGQPRMQRTKRAPATPAEGASSQELEYEPLKFKNVESTNDRSNSGSLSSLVHDIEKQVKNTESLWHHLPYSMCNKEDLAASASNEAECWNGNQISSYLPEVVGNGLELQNNNPEVEVDLTQPNAVVSQQVLTLKLMSARLTHAYNGIDVEWMDTAHIQTEADKQREVYTASGSGSGDGYDDNDDEDGDPRHSGGSGYYDDTYVDGIEGTGDGEPSYGEDRRSNQPDSEFDFTLHPTAEAPPRGHPSNTPRRRPDSGAPHQAALASSLLLLPLVVAAASRW